MLTLLVLKLPKSINHEKDLALSKKLIKLDPLGATFIVGAVCCLLLALQWGGIILPWNSLTVVSLFVGFGLLTVTFVITQYTSGENVIAPFSKTVCPDRSFVLVLPRDIIVSRKWRMYKNYRRS